MLLRYSHHNGPTCCVAELQISHEDALLIIKVSGGNAAQEGILKGSEYLLCRHVCALLVEFFSVSRIDLHLQEQSLQRSCLPKRKQRARF